MARPINVIKRVWERIAPLQLAETSWDNVSKQQSGRPCGRPEKSFAVPRSLRVEAGQSSSTAEPVLAELWSGGMIDGS